MAQASHDYSIQYTSVDDAIRLCQTLGKGTLMAKVDLKNAFWLCPVHREDWHLLGICWRNQFFIDKCLPFGLRSVPHLFNMVAAAMERILKHYLDIHHCFHYLDNFFFASLPQSDACFKALSDMLLICQAVQAPVKPEKSLRPNRNSPYTWYPT